MSYKAEVQKKKTGSSARCTLPAHYRQTDYPAGACIRENDVGRKRYYKRIQQRAWCCCCNSNINNKNKLQNLLAGNAQYHLSVRINATHNTQPSLNLVSSLE